MTLCALLVTEAARVVVIFGFAAVTSNAGLGRLGLQV